VEIQQELQTENSGIYNKTTFNGNSIKLDCQELRCPGEQEFRKVTVTVVRLSPQSLFHKSGMAVSATHCRTNAPN